MGHAYNARAHDTACPMLATSEVRVHSENTWRDLHLLCSRTRHQPKSLAMAPLPVSEAMAAMCSKRKRVDRRGSACPYWAGLWYGAGRMGNLAIRERVEKMPHRSRATGEIERHKIHIWPCHPRLCRRSQPRRALLLSLRRWRESCYRLPVDDSRTHPFVDSDGFVVKVLT